MLLDFILKDFQFLLTLLLHLPIKGLAFITIDFQMPILNNIEIILKFLS